MIYNDNDLLFYMITYKDYERAVWCLGQLRRHYPTARVVIDVDGDDNPAWANLTAEFGAEVYYGERLFLLERGGAIVKRAFIHHADDPGRRRWMFRIDTDTEIRRRFSYMPGWDYFGTHAKWRNFVQGGCIGLSRHAVTKVLDKGILDRPELVNPITWQGGISETAIERVGFGLVSFDWIVNWAMSVANIRAHNFTEIRSTWKDPIPRDVDCAVAHPCKDIPVDRPI